MLNPENINDLLIAHANQAQVDMERGEINNDEDENKPLLKSVELRQSLRTAIFDSAKFAIPFGLSRLAGAAQAIGNGIVINLKIPGATTVSPVMFMLQQGITGAARGALSAVNTVAGNLNGQKKYDQIGPALNQGLLLGTLLGIPTTALFFTSSYWLEGCGMQQVLAQQAGEYLRGLSYGILPTYWTVADQNFLLSIKRTRSPIILNTILVGSSMAIGFPLAIYKLGLAGLGYGVSAGAVITLLADRFHLYTNRVDGVLDREKYNLFSMNFNSGTSFCELLGLSFPTTLQAISEWLPTMLIAVLSARDLNAQLILDAEQPAMQTLVILNQILLGLGTAATVGVANALGCARACAEQGHQLNELIWRKNARTIGYANIITTTLITLLPALFCAIYPSPLVKLFTNDTLAYPLANSMLRVAGASLLIDGIRNTTTGALLGKKQRADNFFTSLTNLIITGAIATALGYFTQDLLSPLSYFLFRMIGILITAALLLHRWHQGSKVAEATAPKAVSSDNYLKFIPEPSSYPVKNGIEETKVLTIPSMNSPDVQRVMLFSPSASAGSKSTSTKTNTGSFLPVAVREEKSSCVMM